MSKKLTKKQRKENQNSEIQTGKDSKIAVPDRAAMINWLCVLVIILPLLFSKVTIDPVITVRYIFLSLFIISFAVFFYIIKKMPVSFYLPSLSKIVFGLGIAYGLWSLFTLTVAINITEGYYQVARHFLFLLLLFLIMIAVNKEESHLIRLCKAFVILSFVQSIVGIFQYYDIAFTELPGANAKPYGLMANRNLFGSAQMLLLPFVVFCFYKAGIIWKSLSGLALTAIIASIIISQTRSAWIGSIAFIIISLILVIIFSAVNRKRWIVGTVSGIGATALLVLLIRSSDIDGELYGSLRERAGSLAFSATDTAQHVENINERLKIWSRTTAMVKEHPLMGVGAGNWKISIPPYGGEEVVWAYGKFIPDRPHNVYLHVLSETGIPGAIFYFGTWAFVTIIAYRVLVKTKSEDRRVLVILMLAGLVGFACDGFFSFPTERIEHSIYMLLMAGIILGCYSNSFELTEKKNTVVGKKSAIAFILLIAFNLFMGISKYNFEEHMNRAKAYDKKGNYQQVLIEAEAGKSDFVTLDPDNKPFEVYTGLAYKGLKDYPKAITEMNKALRYNPNSPSVYNNLGTVYTDMKQYDAAITNYQKALKISPRFEIVFKNLATNYFLKGEYKECVETIAKMNIAEDQYFNGMLIEAKRLLAERSK